MSAWLTLFPSWSARQFSIKEFLRSKESGGGSCPTILTNKSDQSFILFLGIILLTPLALTFAALVPVSLRGTNE